MRVLVLGGTRFVGPQLVGELLAAGDDVAVFHRGKSENALTADAATSTPTSPTSTATSPSCARSSQTLSSI